MRVPSSLVLALVSVGLLVALDVLSSVFVEAPAVGSDPGVPPRRASATLVDAAPVAASGGTERSLSAASTDSVEPAAPGLTPLDGARIVLRLRDVTEAGLRQFLRQSASSLVLVEFDLLEGSRRVRSFIAPGPDGLPQVVHGAADWQGFVRDHSPDRHCWIELQRDVPCLPGVSTFGRAVPFLMLGDRISRSIWSDRETAIRECTDAARAITVLELIEAGSVRLDVHCEVARTGAAQAAQAAQADRVPSKETPR